MEKQKKELTKEEKAKKRRSNAARIQNKVFKNPYNLLGAYKSQKLRASGYERDYGELLPSDDF